MKLCDTQSVDIVHPDLATSGGLLETKKIGDYAEERGIAMAMHFAGLPISFMANVHCAAATMNMMGLENHSIDVPYWQNPGCQLRQIAALSRQSFTAFGKVALPQVTKHR